MSNNFLRFVLLGCLSVTLSVTQTVTLSAADTWTVPVRSAPIVAEFSGFVEADRGKLTTLLPPGQKLVVSDLAMNGKAVVPGEPVISFDTQLVERDAPQRRSELDEAEAQYRVNLLKLDSTLASLLATAATAHAALATTRAQLAASGTDDAADLALARTRADQAQSDVLRVTRDVQRVQARATAGDASAQQVVDAQHVVTLATLDAQRAQAVVERIAHRDRTIERGRLLVEERRLMGQLGLVRAADGSETADPEQGLVARVAENRLTRITQEASLIAERDARRTAWHEVERDLHDHCPLVSIELLPVVSETAGADEAPRRWLCAPTGSPVPAGWQVADGSVFAAARGWGWDRDLTTRLVSAAPAPAPISATNPATGSETPPVAWCLVRESATWTAAVPDGRWTLRLRLGADVDWDGALVTVDSGGASPQVAYVSNRIVAATFPTVEVAVTVHGGLLRLVIGGEPGKHLYATTAGVLTLHRQTQRGGKTEWVTRPLAFIVEPSAVRISGRASAAVAPLVKPATEQTAAATAEKSGATTSGLRARCATSAVTILPPGLPAISGTVTQVGTKPVGIRLGLSGWNEEDQGLPQDLTHREVLMNVTPDAARHLALRSQVGVRVTLEPPGGITAVPPWLVTWRASIAWVLTVGDGWREVTAERAGPSTLVADLAPGTVLRAPLNDEPPSVEPVAVKGAIPAAEATTAAGATTAEGGFPGEVVAGARVRITMPGGWGRVGTYIPDGSEVAVGDELLTLYNPVIEQQKNQLAQARREAERNYAIEVAARRERLLAAADQRRDHEITEATARFTVAEQRQPPDTVAETQVTAARSVADAAHSTALSVATAALAKPPAAESADRQAAAARASVQAERAALAVAQTTNERDWMAAATATAAWNEALQALGQREADDVLARGEDRVAAGKAAALMAAMTQGQDWVRDFERNKVLRSTAAGRLYWLLAWNDQTRARGKLTKDVWVWGGMPIAEIVDMRKLSFTAELPEALYPQLRTGAAMHIRFPVLGDRRFPATVAEVGQALGQSRDAASAANDERIADHRVFTLTLDLVLPAASDGVTSVQPGLRGILEYP